MDYFFSPRYFLVVGFFNVHNFFLRISVKCRTFAVSKTQIMKKEKKEGKRREVKIPDDAVERLQQLADKKKWSLKAYMESVLIAASNRVSKPLNP